MVSSELAPHPLFQISSPFATIPAVKEGILSLVTRKSIFSSKPSSCSMDSLMFPIEVSPTYHEILNE